MSLICHKAIQDQTRLGIWYIQEDKATLLNGLRRYNTDLTDVLKIAHLERQKSSLAVRLLLHTMLTDNDVKMEKDVHGKPYLPDMNKHISLSHSGSLAAVIISDKECGIDIQLQSDKIAAIRHKFLSEQEVCTSMDQLHLMWSAKESIYKAYGKKRIDFKRDIFIQIDDIHRNFGTFTGVLTRHQETFKYQLYYEIWKQYYLVCAIRLQD